MQKHFPGKKVEEYRRMLGLFGVSGDLALQQVNTFLLYTQKCYSKICKKGQKKNIRVKSLFTKKSVVFCRIIDTFASKWL